MKTILAEASRVPVAKQIEDIVLSISVVDIHTHLYDPAFRELLLWGIDELLIYHYLVAEAFRYLELPYDRFWELSKTEQADLIWEALFLEHSPISEACRGVLTTLHLLGLDVKKRDLPALRDRRYRYPGEDTRRNGCRPAHRAERSRSLERSRLRRVQSERPPWPRRDL